MQTLLDHQNYLKSKTGLRIFKEAAEFLRDSDTQWFEYFFPVTKSAKNRLWIKEINEKLEGVLKSTESISTDDLIDMALRRAGVEEHLVYEERERLKFNAENIKVDRYGQEI